MSHMQISTAMFGVLSGLLLVFVSATLAWVAWAMRTIIDNRGQIQRQEVMLQVHEKAIERLENRLTKHTP